MQLRHLGTFSACAATLNFTRAGEQVHLSQSSVTEQIQALEADLGVKLFIRGHGRLALTPAGERLARMLPSCSSAPMKRGQPSWKHREPLPGRWS